MKEHRKIDVTSFCIGPWNRSPSGLKVDPYVMNIRIYNVFFIDNADSPARWSGFSFDSNSSVPEEQLRIVSAIAEAADISPRDNLAKIAPAVLRLNSALANRRTAPKYFFHSNAGMAPGSSSLTMPCSAEGKLQPQKVAKLKCGCAEGVCSASMRTRRLPQV